MSVKLKLSNVRFHFLRVDQFRFFGDKPPENPEKASRSLSLVAAIESPEDQKRVMDALQAVCVEEFGTKAAAQFAAMKVDARLCVKRGEGYPDNPELAPYLCISLGRQEKKGLPEFRGPDMAAITQAQFSAMAKNGAVGTVVISVWQQNNDWPNRINAELLGIQFGGQPELWSGGGDSASDDDFDAYAPAKASAFDDTPAPAPAGGFNI